MTPKRIHIKNIQLRLPAEMAASARALPGQLGQMIIKNLANELSEHTGTVQIKKIPAVTVRKKRGDAGIEKKITAEIVAKTIKMIG